MSRLKKALKWTSIVLGALVAISLAANAVFVWTTDTRLERQLAAIRAAGDPLTLADLARPPVPPEQNGATYLRRAEAGVDAIHKEVTTVPRFWEWFETEVPMPAEIQKALKAACSAYPDVIPVLQQAAACPDYDAQLDYTLPPEQFLDKMLLAVQAIRADSRVLQFRVRLLIAERNHDEALRTALVLFRLAQHCGRNPMIVSYLAAASIQGIAVDSANLVLQTGLVSKEIRGVLDAELARQERTEGFAWALESERAFGLESFRGFPLRNMWLLSRGYWNQQESAYLDAMQAFLTLSRVPGSHRQAEQTIGQIHEGISPGQGIFAELIFPALQALHHAVVQTRANIRALRVLNALQAHVPAGSNEVPKLSELDLPVETTTDPFDGAPCA